MFGFTPECNFPTSKFPAKSSFWTTASPSSFMKTTTPIVALNIWYHVGSKNEKPGKTGFAHLFEHLMFGGSEHLQGSYIEAMERIGATD